MISTEHAFVYVSRKRYRDFKRISDRVDLNRKKEKKGNARIHIHIYMYIEREREKQRKRKRERDSMRHKEK